MTSPYLIYGANGYTGELIAREAKVRGQAPVLAGRNAAALSRLSDELGFGHRVFSLDDAGALDAALAGSRVVLNCAGPFSRTARPMFEACLRNRVHYVDVTGEIDVFEALAARDADAKARGIVALPGAGFDVVPSDCLAAHLKRRLPSATHLALGFQALGSASRGTMISTIESIGRPNRVRRNGVLTEEALGTSTRTIDFGRGPSNAVSIPWGDVSTAYHSTGIPNIEMFIGLPSIMNHVLRWNGRLAPVLRSPRLQAFLEARVRAGRPGPTAEERALGRSYLWGEAKDASGTVVSSRLVTLEGYALTVVTALAAIEKVLAGMVQPGFHTPSIAFGPDFILEMPGTTRTDD
jgi:short subunit dehydrogenase-like uncharacterized protein